MIKSILILLVGVVLSGCAIVIHEHEPKEEPQKVCVDSTGTFFYECYTGKLIADDAYRWRQ